LRVEEAGKSFLEFLDETAASKDPQWEPLRLEAERLLLRIPQLAPLPAPVAPAAQSPAPKSAPAIVTALKVAIPGVSIEFLPSKRPDFVNSATLADHFLRRRFLDLKLAQNFEDLICLGSLSGVDSYVYQHETVRRVLRQFKGRALLADEVGLGKTIEACLILKEYQMRGMVRRALILTPPSLAPQWRGELIEKFGFAAASPDDAEFRRDPARFWREEHIVVASIAMARLDPHASALAGTAWDMVIVDEAHCLKNRSSSNWKLVNSLQKKFILMLTATPVENNLLELYSLITVLKPGLLSTEAEFKKSYVNAARPRAPKNPDQLRQLLSEVMVRNTRSTVDLHLPHRVAATVVAPPSGDEAKLYDRLSNFVATRYKAADSGKRSGIALEWLQRQAGSSPQVLGRSIARALSSETWLQRGDRSELESLGELAAGVTLRQKGCNSKRCYPADRARWWFLPNFSRLSNTSRTSASAVERRIRCSAESYRGRKRTPPSPGSVMKRIYYCPPGRAARDGNLQFASTVVNFDLPWNPMRIEQRVGQYVRAGGWRDRRHPGRAR